MWGWWHASIIEAQSFFRPPRWRHAVRQARPRSLLVDHGASYAGQGTHRMCALCVRGSSTPPIPLTGNGPLPLLPRQAVVLRFRVIG
jgi:hypothetical protein